VNLNLTGNLYRLLEIGNAPECVETYKSNLTNTIIAAAIIIE